MNLFEQVFNEVVTPFLEPRLKKSSLKAAKGYVQGVQSTRKVALASYGLGAVAATLVTGILLMVSALVGLLPIEPRTALVSVLVLGAILAAASAIVTIGGFKEALWLEKSKANELMEAAIQPWETPYSIPDPRKILSPGEAAKPVLAPGEEAQDSFDRNRELRGPRVNRVPAPSAYDTVDAHVPPATYPSLNTPEAALGTKPIDTTSSLRP